MIGTNLWARIGITLPPTPVKLTKQRGQTHHAATVSLGFTKRTKEEDQKLQEFLAQELQASEMVRGATSRIQHRIRLKPGE